MTISKILPINRNVKPGEGNDKNLYVKAGDFNPLVDDYNSLREDGGVIGGVNIANDSITHESLISFNVPWIITGAAQQNLSTATAVNVTSYLTTIDSTSGALAITLGDGTLKNQLKKLYMIVDGGDVTLTCTSLTGGNTIVFGDVGDYALLAWTGTAWYPVELIGVAITTV